MSTLREIIQKRRSFYHIKDESPISDSELIHLVSEALQHTPSAFNMQSARIALLLGKNQTLFWEKVKETLKNIVSEQQFPATEAKINSFQAGYGTVLFFEDKAVIAKTANQFPLYKDNFTVWAEQANGMLQSNIWMLLEDVGFGVSLQHYNPIIDDAVYQNWDIPQAWRLVAQMPFGIPTEQPGPKEFVPVQERIHIFK